MNQHNARVMRGFCMTDYKRTLADRDPVAVGDFIAGVICGGCLAFGAWSFVNWWMG